MKAKPGYDPDIAALMRAKGIQGPKPGRRGQLHSYQTTTAVAKGQQGAGSDQRTTENSPWQGVYTERPSREPTTTSDVVVPFLQAVIGGVFAGSIIAVIILAIPTLQASPWIPVGIGLSVSGLTWAYLLTDHRQLLREVEEWTRSDINGDGVIGEPETVRLEVKVQRPEGGPQHLFSEIPVKREAFDTWARSVTHGRSLAQSSWTGKRKPFSKPDYEDLLALLAKAHIVRWVNPEAHAQGRELTRMGREALKAYLEVREA
jgi:hypothetical protein